LLNISYQ